MGVYLIRDPFLKEVLADYESALWLDADTVIVDDSRDIREDISEQAMMAMVRHQTVDGDVPNAGVWFVRRAALQFLDDVWAQEGFVNDPWWEQAAIMHLMGYDLTRPVRLSRPTKCFYATEWLSVRWNSHPQHESPSPYIRHATTGTLESRLRRMSLDAQARRRPSESPAMENNMVGRRKTGECRKIITMTASDRPKYLRQVLDALSRCTGIEEYTLIPCIEPGNEEVRQILERVSFVETQLEFNEQRLGCAPNTFNALSRGFEASDFVIHIEEDTVPAPDALTYFEHCRESYRHDAEIWTVAGYHFSPDGRKMTERSVVGRHHALLRQRWFTPWGWATWRDRFQEMAARWDFHSWDTHLNEVLRGDRCQITPVLSRFQNIGAEGGVHVPNPTWHRQNQHLDIWAGILTVASDVTWCEVSEEGKPRSAITT